MRNLKSCKKKHEENKFYLVVNRPVTLRTFAYFEFVDIGVEEEDEAEGHDPFTDGTGDVEGVVLGGGDDKNTGQGI